MKENKIEVGDLIAEPVNESWYLIIVTNRIQNIGEGIVIATDNGFERIHHTLEDEDAPLIELDNCVLIERKHFDIRM